MEITASLGFSSVKIEVEILGKNAALSDCCSARQDFISHEDWCNKTAKMPESSKTTDRCTENLLNIPLQAGHGFEMGGCLAI